MRGVAWLPLATPCRVALTIAALELFSVHLGRELGLYQPFAAAALTPVEVAERTGVSPRYAREWLEQPAVAGLPDVTDEPTADASDRRRYSIPAAHAAGVGRVWPIWQMRFAGAPGVPYARYGPAFRRGQGGVNRPAFADMETWLAALPDVVDRLRADPIGRVADVGCGEGWSTLALAHALPEASIVGYDSDQASIATARRAASASPAGDRIAFHAEDAAPAVGPYDRILILEALHDFARPVEVLRHLRHSAQDVTTGLATDRLCQVGLLTLKPWRRNGQRAHGGLPGCDQAGGGVVPGPLPGTDLDRLHPGPQRVPRLVPDLRPGGAAGHPR